MPSGSGYVSRRAKSKGGAGDLCFKPILSSAPAAILSSEIISSSALSENRRGTSQTLNSRGRRGGGRTQHLFCSVLGHSGNFVWREEERVCYLLAAELLPLMPIGRRDWISRGVRCLAVPAAARRGCTNKQQTGEQPLPAEEANEFRNPPSPTRRHTFRSLHRSTADLAAAEED